MKRLVTVVWVLAMLVLAGGGSLLLLAGTVRAFTPAAKHEVFMGDGFSVEVRKPTVSEIFEEIGIDGGAVSLFTAMSFPVVFIGGCIVPWWYIRRSSPGAQEDSQSFQELHRTAEKLSQRMESLETILLSSARHEEIRERGPV